MPQTFIAPPGDATTAVNQSPYRDLARVYDASSQAPTTYEMSNFCGSSAYVITSQSER
jgi:hypothetical protein